MNILYKLIMFDFMKLNLLFLIVANSSIMIGSNSDPILAACGELLVTQPTALIQLKFPYAVINSDYINTATTTGGTVSGATNFAQLQVNTAVGASAIMSSKYRLNYQPGQGSCCLFTALFTTGIDNNTQLIGMGNFNTNISPNFSNIQDGFFFGYSGTDFGIFQYTNGTSTFTAQGSWNVDSMDGSGPSGMILNPTSGNVYKIQYEWLGFGHINFFIENPATAMLTLVHVIQYANNNIVTSLLNPSLMLMAGVNNSAVIATAVTLKTPCMVGMIEGYVDSDVATINSFYTGSTTNLTSDTNFLNLFTMINNTQFNSITNQVMVKLNTLTIVNTSTNAAVLSLVLNPTFSTSPTYANISTNSVVGIDTTGVLQTPLNGKVLLTLYAASTNGGGGRNLVLDLSSYGIILVPGDVLAIAGESLLGTGGVYVGLSWTERF